MILWKRGHTGQSGRPGQSDLRKVFVNNDLHATAERMRVAEEMLRKCNMCELRCGINRAAGERGRCRLAAESRAYKRYVSLNEELELVPALRVFLGGCNFRCPWCDEAPQAFEDAGRPVTPAAWAVDVENALQRGVRTISLLGGEPTLHVHTILALAAAIGGRVPLALNTNMYMTPEVLGLLDGVITWYLADFKFGNDACAQLLAGVPNYSAVVRRNLPLIAASAQVVVRHVLMPGHLECCFRPVADWVAEHLPGVRFQLYPGYIPCGPASCDPEIGRLNTRVEVQAATEYVAQLNLRGAPGPAKAEDAGTRTAGHDRTEDAEAGAAARGAGLASLTIGPDGRIYCHDLTPELATVLSQLCPGDAELLARTLGSCAAPATTEGDAR